MRLASTARHNRGQYLASLADGARSGWFSALRQPTLHLETRDLPEVDKIAREQSCTIREHGALLVWPSEMNAGRSFEDLLLGELRVFATTPSFGSLPRSGCFLGSLLGSHIRIGSKPAGAGDPNGQYTGANPSPGIIRA